MGIVARFCIGVLLYAVVCKSQDVPLTLNCPSVAAQAEGATTVWVLYTADQTLTCPGGSCSFTVDIRVLSPRRCIKNQAIPDLIMSGYSYGIDYSQTVPLQFVMASCNKDRLIDGDTVNKIVLTVRDDATDARIRGLQKECDLVCQDRDEFQPTEGVVEAENPARATCYSSNDPHMQTFDGVRYEHQYSGVYVLYKHLQLDIEVQAQYRPCGRATCNCAVAIKIYHYVLVYDNCGQLGEWEVVSDSDNPPTLGTLVTQRGSVYVVILPTGVEVVVSRRIGRISINSFLDADGGKVEGLCGFYDGQRANDMRWRDGTESPVQGRYYPGFSASWEVTGQEQSLLDNVAPESTPDPGCPPPTCENPIPEGQCTYTRRLIREGFRDITDKVWQNVRQPASEEFWVNGRVVESVDNEADDEPTWPTPSGITEGQAIAHCQENILDNQLSNKCQQTVPNLNFTSSYEMCIQDILLSDSFSYTETHVTSDHLECEAEINTRVSTWEQNGDGQWEPPVDLTDDILRYFNATREPPHTPTPTTESPGSGGGGGGGGGGGVMSPTMKSTTVKSTTL